MFSNEETTANGQPVTGMGRDRFPCPRSGRQRDFIRAISPAGTGGNRKLRPPRVRQPCAGAVSRHSGETVFDASRRKSTVGAAAQNPANLRC